MLFYRQPAAIFLFTENFRCLIGKYHILPTYFIERYWNRNSSGITVVGCVRL